MIFNSKLDRKHESKGSVYLTFKIDDYRFQSLDPNKEYKIEISENLKETKTSRQRRYIWALLDKIGKEVGETSLDIYTQIIEKAELRIEYIQLEQKAVKYLENTFRVVKLVQGNTYACYFGLSFFDKEETNKLIEEVINYCKNVGVAYDLGMLGL